MTSRPIAYVSKHPTSVPAEEVPAKDVPADLVARLRAAGCVFAEDEAALLVEAGADEAMIQRRVEGEPLEYVLGWAEFMGQRYVIEPGVFIPRHRSELMVEVAAGGIHTMVLDLCCGTGALGDALRATAGAAELWATDIDPAAVRCATKNVHGTVVQGDLFDGLPDVQFDTILANAPYVPSAQIEHLPTDFRDHEWLGALDGGDDGLTVHRRIAAEAYRWLLPGGRLLIEVGEDQSDSIMAEFERHGLTVRIVTDDETVIVVGERPAVAQTAG
jgi:release factor glutamine methyltransferase